MKIRWSHVLGFLCGVFTAVVGSALLKERTSPVEATAEEVAGIISEKLQHHLCCHSTTAAKEGTSAIPTTV